MTDTTAPLTPQQTAALLRANQTLLEAQIAALPPELARWRPAPGEWCVLEVLGHLIETEERGFGGRVRHILAEPRPVFTGWDPDAVARARRDAERDPADLLAEFAHRRSANIAMVEGLKVEDYARAGDHPEVGFLTIGDLLHEWVHHDADHIRQILANIQAYAWPNMGAAQRFSGPEGGAMGGENCDGPTEELGPGSASPTLTPALSPCAGRGCVDVVMGFQTGWSFLDQSIICRHILAHRSGREPGEGRRDATTSVPLVNQASHPRTNSECDLPPTTPPC